jgi:hypothetical protein
MSAARQCVSPICNFRVDILKGTCAGEQIQIAGMQVHDARRERLVEQGCSLLCRIRMRRRRVLFAGAIEQCIDLVDQRTYTLITSLDGASVNSVLKIVSRETLRGSGSSSHYGI